MSSLIIGIDLVPIRAIRGVRTIVGDITTQKARQVPRVPCIPVHFHVRFFVHVVFRNIKDLLHTQLLPSLSTAAAIPKLDSLLAKRLPCMMWRRTEERSVSRCSADRLLG